MREPVGSSGASGNQPMHPRDRRLYLILAWSAVPAALIVGCFIAWGSGQLPWYWAIIGIFIGLSGMGGATLYALEKKAPALRNPSPILFTITALTWLLIGWQAWLSLRPPSEGYTQAQLDKAVEQEKGPLQSKLDAANRQLQEQREKAKPLIPTGGVVSGSQATAELKDLRDQIDELKRDNNALRATALPPKNPAPNGPIIWDDDSQFLVVSGGGPSAEINSVLIRGKSTALVSIKEAYAISELTGHRQDFMANVQYRGYYPVDKVDIPADAPVWLELVWKPPLSVRDFLDQWGKFRITIVYNGITYEKEFDENYIRRKLQVQNAGTLGPHVTPKDDK